jgi:hypothetical protein
VRSLRRGCAILGGIAVWLCVAAPAAASAAEPPAPVDAPAEASASVDEDDPPLRLSLPTQADRDAWRTAGFRVESGLLYGGVSGLGGAPDGVGWGFFTRVGARLDADWSLLLAFRYGAVSGAVGQDLLGLRYAVTAQPVLHLGERWSVAMGLGVAGFVEGGSGRPEPDGATRDALVAPYTVPGDSAALPSCNGAGAVAQLRLAWTFVLGPMSATALEAMVDGQRSLCVDDTGRVEPDTATAIVRRQWWTHVGWSFGWSFQWR